MSLRALFIAAGLAVATLVTAATAEAGTGHATVSVVLRAGPNTGYGRVVVIPAGARVEVYRCKGWCEVGYGGYRGWAYGGCIRLDALHRAKTLYVSPVPGPGGPYLTPVYVPPQPAYLASAKIQPPSVDRFFWYEARTFYYDGRYLDRPDMFAIVGR